MTQVRRPSYVFSMKLTDIEAEIRGFLGEIDAADVAAGRAVIEIGRRLQFVKGNLTKHGEWLPWLDRMGIAKRTAQSYLKAVKQFGNTPPAAHLSATKLFELASVPSSVDLAAFLTDDHVIPSTGEIKPLIDMTKEEVREVVRAERERAGLVKPKKSVQAPTARPANPFESVTLDVCDRVILDGLPLSVALKAVRLDMELLLRFLDVAGQLSGRLITEHYDDILADIKGGKRAVDIIRPYKKPIDKQPLSGLRINPYEIFGVWNGVSEDEVKRKYRELARKVHPDTGGSELLFKVVNAAWEVYKRS